jgi:hypothetical protein
MDGPIDLERLLSLVPIKLLKAFGAVTRRAFGSKRP